MAKYDVHFSCGHTETIQLFKKETERKRRIEWLEKYGICSECYRKSLDEQHKEYVKNCNDIGLFITEGTEKQIRWAYQIAAQFLNNDIYPFRDKANKAIAEHSKDEENAKAFLEVIQKILDVAVTKGNAKFWIDHRENREAFEYFKKEVFNEKESSTNET